MEMNFQTVFDDAVEAEKNFDNMFGAEEDDELMDMVDVVLGEESAADDIDFNTLDDGETANQLRKDLEGEEIEKPTIDSDGSFEIDDFDAPGKDIACTKYGVADAVEKKEIDVTNLEDEIDKSENKSDIDDLEESAFLDDIFTEETDDMGVEQDQINDNDEAEEFENNDNEVNDTMDDEEKPEGLGDISEDVSGDGVWGCPGPECDNPPVVYDTQVEDDENLDDTFKDDEDITPEAPSDNGSEAPAPEAPDVENLDDTFKDEDIEEGCAGKPKKEENEDIDDEDSDEGAPADDIAESALLDDIFTEEAEEDDSEEDEIIDIADDDESELSPEEIEDIADEGDDDELVDLADNIEI